MTFPEKHAPRRTDENFKALSDEDHHQGVSHFTELNIDMVSCFPHDYMHLACLGVVCKFLDLWMGLFVVTCQLVKVASYLTD